MPPLWVLLSQPDPDPPPPPCEQSVRAAASGMAASAMDYRSSTSKAQPHWVSSSSSSSHQDIPADLTIRIADTVFPLHKAVMAPKCGYIRRAVAQDTPTAAEPHLDLDLSALPGGADAFDKAARYCYGANFEITARNAAALRCAAAFLDVPELARSVDEFLAQAALPAAVAVLRACEGLLPAAEELGLARRAADAVALRVCNEALFPTRAPPGWWAPELAALAPASFRRVVTALRCRRAAPEVVAGAASAYAELVLAEVLAEPRDCADQRALLESVVAALPDAADAPIAAAFLCRLLHAAVNTEASASTCRDLELRVAAVLDQATVEDLLGVALDGARERVRNTDTVRRVVAAFVERHRRAASEGGGGGRGRRASLSSGAEDASGALEKVARTVDDLAAEMATEESLPVSKFVGVAGSVPKDARASHDCLYRAVDVYLKAHPALDEMEREKVCSVMDPLRLSYQARLHASQNKRLPLQAMLSALYYDQLKLRSATAAQGCDGAGWEDTLAAAGKARAQAMADASLARENEALRAELARMRAYLSGMQVQHSKGREGSRLSSPSRAPAKKKKARFLGARPASPMMDATAATPCMW
ncbi:hypothetical protein BS78_05G017000 [Paspalum vaginatum]|nr:hypothetical protein BS78_05G017000 [Paspalum vaginatum]